MASYKVLDVSKFNTVTDYATAATQVNGVLMRAGYRGYGSSGTLVTDTKFETHYNGFNTCTKVGVYWFSQAITVAEAQAEADYVYNLIKNKNISFPVYIDSEYSNTSHNGRADSLSKADRTTITIAFLERIKTYGYRAGVYASDSWFKTNLDYDTLKASYSIWCARYSTSPPSYATVYDGWQYTSSGSITGVTGNVDLSTFVTDVAGWDTKKQISSDYIDGLEWTSHVYTGELLQPKVYVKSTITLNVDYEIWYNESIEVGDYVVAVVGKGNYEGYVIYPYYITEPPKLNISDYVSVTVPDNIIYDGNPKYVTINTALTENTDYTVSYSNNVNPGTATCTITGINSYTGVMNTNFVIKEQEEQKKNISNYIYIGTDSFTYDKTAHVPTITYVSETLVENTDYTMSCVNNVNAGTATCTITGINKYEGTITGNYTINKAIITDYVSGVTPAEYTFTGDECKPDIISSITLTKNTDYTIEYNDNINVGTASAVVTGINNFQGSVTYSFNIISQHATIKNIQDYITELSGPTSFVYDGTAHEPAVNPNGLTQDVDFTVKYTNNINVGTGICTVNGIDNYQGTVTLTFTITKASLSGKTLSLEYSTCVYDTLEKKPTATISGLTQGTDYSVYYEDNINVGTATVTATGSLNYEGTTIATFEITAADISTRTATIPKSVYKYTGSEIKPEVTIDRLVKDTDFTVTYTNNTNIGTAKIVCTGINNYTGTINLTFEISRMSVEDYFLSVDESTLIYNGKSQHPTAYINNVSPENYTVRYPEESIDAGTYTIYADGVGEWDGTISTTFTITGKSIVNYKPYFDTDVYSYRSDYIKPTVHIDGLVEDTDFTVTYSDNYNPGTARATIDGIGNYSGSTYIEFQIVQTNISTCIAKLGTPSLKTIYRIYNAETDKLRIYFSQDAYENEKSPLTEEYDYHINSCTSQIIRDFTLITFEVKALGGYYGSVTYRFRVVDEEPSTPIDYTDDGVYNFGDIDDGDETAVGYYDFLSIEAGDNDTYDGQTVEPTIVSEYISYDGELHVICNPGTPSEGTFMYGYTTSQSIAPSSYSSSVPRVSDAGIYYVWAEIINGESIIKAPYFIGQKAIDKATGELKLTATSTIVPATETETITTIVINKSGGAITLAVSDETVATATLAGSNVVVTKLKAGVVNVSITSAGSDNYYEATAEFNVTFKEPEDIIVTSSGFSGEYDGNVHGITVVCDPSNAVVKYGTEEGTYGYDESPKYSDVGTYTIYYQASLTGYITTTGYDTVEIKEKTDLNVTATGFSGDYDGNEHGITVTCAQSGAVIKYGNTEETCTLDESPKYIETGLYTVYYKVTCTGYASVSGSNSIEIKEKEFTDIVATGFSGDYDGAAHGITVTTSVAGHRIAYGTTYGNYDLTESPSYTAVGTYTVYYAVYCTGYKTVEGNATIEIKAKDFTDIVATGFSGDYDGNPHGITVTSGVTGYSVAYGTTYGTYDQSTSPTYTEVGTYTVYYKVTCTGYNPSEGSATVEIKEVAKSQFYNKTYDVIGDSYMDVPDETTGGKFAIENLWWHKAAEHFNMTLNCNGSIGGAVIGETTAQNFGASWIGDQITGLTSEADYVFVTIGGNDVGYLRYYSMTQYSYWIPDSEFSVMEDYYKDTIAKVKAKYPNAKVVLFAYPLEGDPSTAWAYNGAGELLRPMEKSACESTGDIFVSLPFTTGTQYVQSDGLHPNQTGMDLMAQLAIDIMEEL